MIKLYKYVCGVLSVLIIVLFGVIVVQSLSSDKKGPEISFDSDSVSISVKDDKSVLLNGVSAKDNRDGDVTDSVIVENLSDFADDGSRNVTYAAYDSSDNVTKASRKLVYSDYKSPEYALSASTTFFSSDATINIAEMLSANDIFDGDITSFIKLVDDNIVVGQGGKYTATVSVYNSAGDSSTLELPVFIESSMANSSAPVVNLSNYLVYAERGNVITDWKQYIESVKNRSNSSNMSSSDKYKDLVVIDDSNVDFSTSGSYYVSYEYTNPSDLTSITRLIVVVK